ncbi:MAG: TVP38/TMEM64 family protein [Candidatus Omnitrophica bacterium]|nr:TVP38/TMEM64 family protein [Candidatus Omnitrophota bacterium]
MGKMKRQLFSFLLFVVLIVVFFNLGKFFAFDEGLVQNFFLNIPVVLSGVIFILVYVVSTSLIWFGPKDILRIVAAGVFGAYLSTLLIWLAELGNVFVLFMLSRRLGRDFVASKLHGGMKRLDQTIAETSFWSIFCFRLFPIIPLRVLDLGFGLTKISFKKYFWISFIGTPLRIFVIQFFLAILIKTGMSLHQFEQDPFAAMGSMHNILNQYLNDHPGILFVCFFYLLGSIVTIFILRRNSLKKDPGQFPPSSPRK